MLLRTEESYAFNLLGIDLRCASCQPDIRTAGSRSKRPKEVVKVKITIDTATDTHETVIATIRAAYGLSSAEDDAYVYPCGYTRGELRRFASLLAARDTREAVRYICSHGPEVSIESVRAHLNEYTHDEKEITSQGMGGKMSGIGSAALKIKGGEPPAPLPYETDRNRGVYRIDADVAAILLDALGSDD